MNLETPFKIFFICFCFKVSSTLTPRTNAPKIFSVYFANLSKLYITLYFPQKSIQNKVATHTNTYLLILEPFCMPKEKRFYFATHSCFLLYMLSFIQYSFPQKTFAEKYLLSFWNIHNQETFMPIYWKEKHPQEN